MTGWVRADGTGGSTDIVGHSTRAISSTKIGRSIGREVLTGFLALKSEDPAPDKALEPVESAGPRRGPALLLRPAVVVLRRPGRGWLRLPGLGRAQARAPR
ncbi:hypothetical protein G5V59_04520 [Nocardioides sp. W3-2-3]|uniref:hypothetical protein n=1 Tax=Nocardioides convexus TaxID=2712224 RepID=UPI0024181CA5|nr:hypothetical protein [Nocardioides convexus]NGZ99829.1 hypothetical protein [Nocardioides convexus]